MILKDGFSTIITFGSTPTVLMKEKTVTPPGVTGGGGIDINTMRNTRMRMFHPKALVTVKDAAATVAYDPAVIDEIMAMIQVIQQITFTFPDDSTETIYGWLDDFTPQAHVEGTQPTADIVIIAANNDGAASPTEQDITYAA